MKSIPTRSTRNSLLPQGCFFFVRDVIVHLYVHNSPTFSR